VLRQCLALAAAVALCISYSPALYAADTGQSAPTSTPAPSATEPVDLLDSSRSLIAAKKFKQALVELERVNKIISNNADVFNLLGFASRKSNKLKDAETYYRKALTINPTHLGALEYQGELFILQKKLPLAKSNLAKLKSLCGLDCEEYLDLKKAIKKKNPKKNKY